MCTGQKYDATASGAIMRPSIEPAAQYTPQPPFSAADNRLLLDWLWLRGTITDEQRDWSSVILIPDDSMAPQLRAGGLGIAYLLDPSEFKKAIGQVVALTTKENPDIYVVGRIQKLSKTAVYVSRDEAEGKDLVFLRREISQLSEVIYAINPLL